MSLSYKQEVLRHQPIRYFRMDDQSASAVMYDSAGRGNGAHLNTPTLNQRGGLASDPNPAVLYNGSNQASSVAVDLSPYTHVTLEFWLWWSSYANDDKLAIEYSTAFNLNDAFVVDPDGNSIGTAGQFLFGMGCSVAGSTYWTDGFTRPSAGAWHHYVLDMNRPVPTNIAYVDGVRQTLTAGTHSGLFAHNNFGNFTLYLMSRAGSSLFCPAGSLIDEVAIYDGSQWGTGVNVSLDAMAQAHFQAATQLSPLPSLASVLTAPPPQSRLFVPNWF